MTVNEAPKRSYRRGLLLMSLLMLMLAAGGWWFSTAAPVAPAPATQAVQNPILADPPPVTRAPTTFPDGDEPGKRS